MTDTELAIAALPRLHAAGIATDLHWDEETFFTLHDPSMDVKEIDSKITISEHHVYISDAQAITYIVGCAHNAARIHAMPHLEAMPEAINALEAYGLIAKESP